MLIAMAAWLAQRNGTFDSDAIRPLFLPFVTVLSYSVLALITRNVRHKG